MPELPEVETIARGVDERLRGDRIETTWFSGKPEPFKSSPQLMAKELPGRRIDRVHRVGKHIVFDLEDGKTSRPAMDCAPGHDRPLLVADAGDTCSPPHAWHPASGFGKGTPLCGPRRFGRMELQRYPNQKNYPLHRHRPGTLEHLERRIRRALSAPPHLHQSCLAESETAARSGQYLCRREPLPRRHPAAQDGPPPQAGRTGPPAHAALQTVLREAISWVALLFRTTWTRPGVRRLFPTPASGLYAHRPALPGLRNPIRRILVAGRGTHYCPSLPALDFYGFQNDCRLRLP